MAQFEGTVKEFTKFIGAYARLKVAFMAAKYKKQMGKCEDCGFTNSLEAAHKKERGRALITANILSEFIEDNLIKIDLNEFEDRFMEAHLPIEATIRVLCKECHWKYDKITKQEPTEYKTTQEADESVVIESLIKGQMNKAKALKISHTNNLTSLTNSNSVFSNIISVQDGWWLQPHNDKFKSDFHMILNDDRSNKLFIFHIPANTIKSQSAHFKQRNDKYRSNCSDIYIATSGTQFQEKNGFEFSKFLIETIDYSL